MPKDRPKRMSGISNQVGEFGFQPIEKRGYQPVASPRSPVTSSSPTTSAQVDTASVIPPNQGSSAKK